MFKTNIKIAWRNLLKDRKFTLLNIMGLSAGLACTLLIYLWVTDELSFDKFFADNDRVYQLMETHNVNGTSSATDESSGNLAKEVITQVPGVEYAAAFAPPGWYRPATLSVNNNNIRSTGQYADKDYFNIFSFKLLSGTADKALASKDDIAISATLAKKLFGTTDNLIGKPIKIAQDKTFFVSAVFQDMPANSSQQFDFVRTFDYLREAQTWVTAWGNLGPHNFIKLKKGTSLETFNKEVADVITKAVGDTTRKVFAQRFSEVYLNGINNHGAKGGNKMDYVRLFSLIAIFILVIACINFMNLSTAKAARRMKEVGIKKVVGAKRQQLVFQFLSESMLLTLMAMAIAIAIAWALLPQFNQLTGKQITLQFDANIIIAIIAIALATGLLAGSYPAFYLSKFNPLAILKGKLSTSFAEAVSRKGLVVFQFALSAVLIVAVMVIYNQVQYIQKADAGFGKENVMRFDAEGRLHNTEHTFMAELKRIPGVVNASVTFDNMIGHSYADNGIKWPGLNPNAVIYFESFRVGYDFIETLGMHVLQGRSFSKNYGSDSTNIIINEAAVKIMNIKDPVGKTVTLYGKPVQIIGVVKDFNFESMHEVVKPSYMVLRDQAPGNFFKMMVRIKQGDQQQTIASIKGLYERYNPGFPFTFNFLDDLYQKQYETEARIAVLSRYFAGLAIIISCLGLFGLAAFTAQKRQKEIGIRKVIGASVGDITTMLSKDFLKLVVISLLVAFPIAYYVMNNWLQSFAYRVNVGYMVFVLTGGFVVFITLATISFQSIKAALANPVRAIKAE